MPLREIDRRFGGITGLRLSDPVVILEGDETVVRGYALNAASMEAGPCGNRGAERGPWIPGRRSRARNLTGTVFTAPRARSSRG